MDTYSLLKWLNHRVVVLSDQVRSGMGSEATLGRLAEAKLIRDEIARVVTATESKKNT
jgi:hypothetical protein